MADDNKAPAPKADDTAGLVKMKKDGEKPLYVHPTCVKDHEVAGWTKA